MTDEQLDAMLTVANAANSADEADNSVWIQYWNTFHPRTVGRLITALKAERAAHQATQEELEAAREVGDKASEVLTELNEGIFDMPDFEGLLHVVNRWQSKRINTARAGWGEKEIVNDME